MESHSPSSATTAAERAFQALKKDYALVGKTHIRAWHAWLVIGVLAGTVAGIAFVANRSGEVEGGRAAEDDMYSEELLSTQSGEFGA